MANIASVNLHELIHHMTPSEKRYFKVYASRHIPDEHSNYCIMFDAIDRQEVYDEKALITRFRKRKFINRFSIAKNRLYNAIIRSLDAFHVNNSTEAQLHRQLHAVEILYNKSLYDQSFKLIKGVQRTAEKYELFNIAEQASKWEKRIIEKNNYEGVSDAKIQAILESDSAYTKTLEAGNQLWNVKSKIFSALYIKGKMRSKIEAVEFESIMSKLEYELKDKPVTKENTYLLNHIYSAYHFGMGDYASCYPYLLENLKLIKNHPNFFKLELSILPAVLSNAVYVGMRLGKMKEAFKHFEVLKNLMKDTTNAPNEDRNLRVFSLVRSIELVLYSHSGEFEKGLAVLPEIEKELIVFSEKLSSVKKAHFYFNISVILFGAGNFHDALKWVNKLINEVEIDKSQDIRCMGNLLNLVIHLELGNVELMSYILRSTKRFLETRKRVYAFEKIFLQFVNDILRKRVQMPVNDHYQQLILKLKELKNDPYEKPVFEYFDFLNWAESKLNDNQEENQLAA